MSNYIVSYDLNGSSPAHSEMDEHIESAGWTWGRVLETVWYVGTEQTAEQVFDHVSAILSDDDLLLVVEAGSAIWNDLLVDDDTLQLAWRSNG